MLNSFFSFVAALIIFLPLLSSADDPFISDIPDERQNPLWVERNMDGSVKAGGLQDQPIGPCEEFGDPSLTPEKQITIDLNQRERELIHLVLIGFEADLEHELEGVGGWTGSVFPPSFGGTGSPQEPDPSLSTADPAFFARSQFLNYFIKVVLPSVGERVYGMDRLSDTGGPGDATEEELGQSVQSITFTACERTALSIATEKWSGNAWGQMGRHLRLCDHSQELRNSSACSTFPPLELAYQTLRKKIEKDQ